jgi:5'-methylthioadenosine phosphorylase
MRASAIRYARGGDGIGMTAMPEARLAREAELPYALVGMVTDYDSWREGEAVEAEAVLRQMRANAALARAAIVRLVEALPAAREPSPIDTALDRAIVTPRAAWDRAALARLDAVMRRLLA